MLSLLDSYHNCLWSMLVSQSLFDHFTDDELVWMTGLSQRLEFMGFKTWSELKAAVELRLD